MNYEAWNQYVLTAIGVFAALLYISVVFVGLPEFMAAMFKRGNRKKRSRHRITLRRLRNTKVQGTEPQESQQ